jgi:uracil-DNA glycosylase
MGYLPVRWQVSSNPPAENVLPTRLAAMKQRARKVTAEAEEQQVLLVIVAGEEAEIADRLVVEALGRGRQALVHIGEEVAELAEPLFVGLGFGQFEDLQHRLFAEDFGERLRVVLKAVLVDELKQRLKKHQRRPERAAPRSNVTGCAPAS